MDVDRAIALVAAAGIELTDRRRNSADNGWSLSFSNGAELDVRDNGRIAVSGKGRKSVASLLGLAGKSIGSRKPRSSAPSHR
ncbi:MAG: hypothetical protein E6G87_05515 [Alphaproteobacteria bacterium]|nr:MAG: hypothetical protein E6G87_05515 [Alphaproteobacteria bacterium]